MPQAVPGEAAFEGIEPCRLGYWISIGGKLARSGRVQVRVDSYLRTIRQSEDDFINVCINDTETLYSGGGRLFCFPREFSYSMRLLR